LDAAVPGAGVERRPVVRVRPDARETGPDDVAVERPLAIRIAGRDVAVTLRTPGHDAELALGFLAGEGVLRTRADVAAVTRAAAGDDDAPDVIDLALAPGVALDWSRLERHFAATSACGLCGRARLESLRAGLAPATVEAAWTTAALLALPARLAGLQPGFAATGGLHAAVLCDAGLEPLVLREDVGRHNAVDKAIGWRLDHGDRTAALLWVSGRAGAELALKAARAGLAALVAVGAPTTLAIEIAEAAGLTLAGFLRADRMNVYAGAGRVRP
jgi:FdhD protein